MTRRRLVLVGGGHAHLEVLRSAARRPFAADLVLVSPYARQVYSGMMPAQLRGAWDEAHLAVDLPALCRAAGARFVGAAADALGVAPNGAAPGAAPGGVSVRAGGACVDGDLLSLDVGSVPAALDVPGAREHGFGVRPLARWRALVARLAALSVVRGAPPLACCVVGGGAAGAELSLAVLARAAAGGRGASVTLVEGGPALLPSWGAQAGRVRRLLVRRGVRVLTGRAVARVDADAVTLAGGERVASELTVWVPGAAALPLAREAGLPVDERGFLRVDATLRAAAADSLGAPPVWGAGDCVALDGAPWVPKAGVYAVREAPVLAHNLRLAAEGSRDEPRRYVPQRDFLAALDTADGRAFVRWRGVATHSRAALALKRAIDERFVRRYQRLGEGAR